MPTVADLAAAEFQEVGYLLVIEGWDVAFTNQADLAGSGPGSWIGESYGARRVLLGLEVPATVKVGIDIINSGMLDADAATFTIVDRDEEVIAFATDEPGDPVFERLAPTQNPAPASLVGGGGETVTLHGRHINGEAIGPAGERRQFQILPSGSLPGLDHAALDSAGGDLRASTVRDAARWLEGRPVALYLIRQAPDGTWPGWQAQFDSGSSLLWWGTLTSAEAESHAWKLNCEGPSSWLRKPLNVNRPADWQPLRTIFDLGPGEDKMGCFFVYSNHLSDYQLGASSIYTASDTLTGETAAELADEINTRLQTVAATAGPMITYTVDQGGQVGFTEDALSLRIADVNNYVGGKLYLRMHKRTWLRLGWDLTLQKRSADQLSTPVEVEAFIEPNFYPPWGAQHADPAPGYWGALFGTCPVGVFWNNAPDQVDGGGAVRLYQPLYPGGVELLEPEAGRQWVLGVGVDVPYLEGQLARPPADKVLDAGACNATAFFAVRGSHRDSLEGDTSTRYQLAKVSWRKSTVATTIELDSESRAVVWCERWLHPDQFGAPNEKLTGPWAVNDAEIVPVAVLGYNLDKPDLAHVVLARLLLSSGTAAWSGTEGDPNASIAVGDNGHPDALLGAGEDLRGNDLEIADLGLGIPADLVDWSSIVAAAEALPGGKAGPLNRCRLAYVGPFDSQEALVDLITPRGWCFSLKGGKYGLFARSTPLDPADADVTISPADIAAEPDAVPPVEVVDLRPLEPVDLVTVTYGANQIGDDSDEKTVTVKARDPRAQQRRGNAKVEINGRSLLPDGSWLKDFRDLWGVQLARHFAEPHAMLRVKVKGNVARSIWPGSIVRYTSPWPATRDGSYGMTAKVGRVVSVTRDLQTLAAEVEILIAAGDTTATNRRFAPIARLVDDHTTVEERHDAGTRTLACYADAFGRGGAVSDVAAFEEPAWLGVGGALKVNAWASYDGVTWESVASFEVESVDTALSTITYAAGTLTGSIPERRFVVLLPAPYEDQAASSWPRALWGVIAGSDGKFGAANLAAYPWSE